MSLHNDMSCYTLIDGLDRYPPKTPKAQMLMDNAICRLIANMSMDYKVMLLKMIEKHQLNMVKSKEALQQQYDAVSAAWKTKYPHQELPVFWQRPPVEDIKSISNAPSDSNTSNISATYKMDPQAEEGSTSSEPSLEVIRSMSAEEAEDYIHQFLFQNEALANMDDAIEKAEYYKNRYPNMILLHLRRPYDGASLFIEALLEQECDIAQDIIASSHWQRMQRHIPKEAQYYPTPISRESRNLLTKYAASGQTQEVADMFFEAIGIRQYQEERIFLSENRFLLMALLKASEVPISLVAAFLNLVDAENRSDFYGEYYRLDSEAAKLLVSFYATANRYARPVTLRGLSEEQGEDSAQKFANQLRERANEIKARYGDDVEVIGMMQAQA